MKIWMKRTLGDYKAGKTYEIPDWEARRFINAGAANPVLSEKQAKVEEVIEEVKKKSKRRSKAEADPLTLGEMYDGTDSTTTS